jgi:hypothetical protein
MTAITLLHKLRLPIGGIRRGTGVLWVVHLYGWSCKLIADIVKALALGARAVGMGRPFLYAQSVVLSFPSQRPILTSTIHLRHMAWTALSKRFKSYEERFVQLCNSSEPPLSATYLQSL